MSDPDYDFTNWTDPELVHFLESSGSAQMAGVAVHGPEVHFEDEHWEDWKKPEHMNIHRAVAEAYMYGMYMHRMMCEKWHKHCIDQY